jgi:hypothetical protein
MMKLVVNAQNVDEKIGPFDSCTGLPDFSWYKLPKREKYAKLLRPVPNVLKI